MLYSTVPEEVVTKIIYRIEIPSLSEAALIVMVGLVILTLVKSDARKTEIKLMNKE